MPKIIHPYENLDSGKWLRGNLHTHTTASDGRGTMQQVIDFYASKNHHFLMISDHDTLTQYDDYNKINSKGLILIPGNEITANGPHLLHVNPDKIIEPDSDRQIVIDQVNQSQGFIIVNHPNWQDQFDHCTMENLEQWENYTGMEIYNGVIGPLAGSPYATNKWDQLLTKGRRLWGFANDDLHWLDDYFQQGWNVAYAHTLTAQGIVDALSQGRFYASTGVTITDIRVTNNTISIDTENAQRIVALKQGGRRAAVVDDTSIELQIPDDAKYIRFQCWGSGEQFAWTQPFFIEQD